MLLALLKRCILSFICMMTILAFINTNVYGNTMTRSVSAHLDAVIFANSMSITKDKQMNISGVFDTVTTGENEFVIICRISQMSSSTHHIKVILYSPANRPMTTGLISFTGTSCIEGFETNASIAQTGSYTVKVFADNDYLGYSSFYAKKQ